MAFAVLQYGAPSRYAELARDSQDISMRIADQNQRQAAAQNQMWYDAVSGGFDRIGQSMLGGMQARQQRQWQQEDQLQDQQFALDRVRETMAINAGFPSWSDLADASAASGLSVPEFVAQTQSRAQRFNDDRILERSIRQNAAEQLLAPISIPQEAQNAIASWSEQDRQHLFGLIKQHNDLRTATVGPNPKVSMEAGLREIGKSRGEIDSLLNRAMMTQPSLEQRAKSSIVTLPDGTKVMDAKADVRIIPDNGKSVGSDTKYIEAIQEIEASNLPQEEKAAMVGAIKKQWRSVVEAIAEVTTFTDENGETATFDLKNKTFKRDSIRDSARAKALELANNTISKMPPVKPDGEPFSDAEIQSKLRALADENLKWLIGENDTKKTGANKDSNASVQAPQATTQPVAEPPPAPMPQKPMNRLIAMQIRDSIKKKVQSGGALTNQDREEMKRAIEYLRGVQ